MGGRGAFVAKMSDTTLWHELFSLIVAVQPKLHRVSYNNETIPNAHKHYETDQKMGLLSNGLDQVRSLQKMSHTTSWHELFSLITLVQPKLHRVSQTNEMVPDAPKHYETHQNMNLGSNAVDLVRSLRKCSTRLCAMNSFH